MHFLIDMLAIHQLVWDRGEGNYFNLSSCKGSSAKALIGVSFLLSGSA